MAGRDKDVVDRLHERGKANLAALAAEKKAAEEERAEKESGKDS